MTAPDAAEPRGDLLVDGLQGVSVLYVEDDVDVREPLARLLKRRVGSLHLAADGQEGLAAWRRHRPDVVVTDIMMPVMGGLDMAAAIRREDATVPIIVTSAHNDTEYFLKAIDLGIDKYVLKPVRTDRLLDAIRKGAWEARASLEKQLADTVFNASSNAIVIADGQNRIIAVNAAFCAITGYAEAEAIGRSPSLMSSGRHDAGFYREMWQSLVATGAWSGEIWNRRKNGDLYAEWLTINAVKNSRGEILHFVAIFSDITQRKTAEEEIRHLAFYDPLTRLPNRRLLFDRLQQALVSSARSRRRGALLFIDLDNFKTLNDTLGHDMGDLLLQQVARRLEHCVREGDTVARLGGDEFVVMLEDLSEGMDEAARQAETVGEKVLETLNQAYLLGDHVHHGTPSIGLTLFRGRETAIDELMKRADLAMYEAKAAGRNTMRFFDPDMQAVVSARAALEAGLREALRLGQFVLHYQPQVDDVGRQVGAEALIRWHHPQRGLVSPAEFIPVAEETGLILPIGEWVLRTACDRLAAWSRQPETALLTLAVNISARQFRLPDFVRRVQAALEDTGAPAHRLKLELTESLLIDDIEDVVVKMAALKACGVSFSLDDFGTGYSSLVYLKRLPLDQLKIDRAFIHDVLTDPNDAAIARAIIALGQSLGLAVIAEGVENGEQRRFLAAHGCSNYQGYLFGRPEPLEPVETCRPTVPSPEDRR